MKHIYFARHGETVANKQGVLSSRETELTEAGVQQADVLAKRFEHIELDTLFVSDYIRAQETVAPIARQKQLEPITEAVFGEIGVPTSLVGKPLLDDQLVASRTAMYQNCNNPDWQFEDAESLYMLTERVKRAQQYLEEADFERCLVVSHSYFLRHFTAVTITQALECSKEVVHISRNLKMSNTGISYFTCTEAGEWQLVIHNDHAHFAE